MKAEAYGFESRTQKVNIPANDQAEANFSLQPLEKRTISGTIVNETTGEKVKDATVYLVEDAKIEPVKTDESGEFSLEALSGVYTVKVFAKGFKGYSFTADVTEKPLEKAIKLEPFIGFAGEIGYDDGTPENARAFYDPGNGWAVKFSLEKGKKQAQVTGGFFVSGQQSGQPWRMNLRLKCMMLLGRTALQVRNLLDLSKRMRCVMENGQK